MTPRVRPATPDDAAGFRECGRLVRQVAIDGVEEDELMMEMFL